MFYPLLQNHMFVDVARLPLKASWEKEKMLIIICIVFAFYIIMYIIIKDKSHLSSNYFFVVCK